MEIFEKVGDKHVSVQECGALLGLGDYPLNEQLLEWTETLSKKPSQTLYLDPVDTILVVRHLEQIVGEINSEEKINKFLKIIEIALDDLYICEIVSLSHILDAVDIDCAWTISIRKA